MKFQTDCWPNFVEMLRLCVYLHLLHFVALSTIYAAEPTFWLAVTHTFKVNGSNLADWSK